MAQQQQQQQQGVGLDWDQFTCSICLDLLKEPVSINCGHNYCRTCIDGCWDQEEEKGVYSCPQCRESFSPRPALRRNNMLVELLEKLKKTEVQQASSSAPLSYAGPEDVACDFCTGTRRHKAVMSCLTCLVSYCDTHLQPHYSAPMLKRHKLVPATDCLQEKMCSSHNKLMEVYCRTDQQCICLLCAMDEHKGHNTVSAAAERAEIQKHLSVSQQRVQESIQERERELEELRQAVEDLKTSPPVKDCFLDSIVDMLLACTDSGAHLLYLQSGSAQTAVEDSERIFTEMISSIERRSREVKELIRDQEKTAVCPAEGRLLQLEEEIAKLRRNQTDLEKLSHTDDHIHFIQNFQSLLRPSGSPDLPSIVVGPLRYFRDVSDAVSDLRDKLENILKDTWPRISATGSWKEYETRNMSLQRNIVSSYMSSGIKDMIIYLCCFDSLFRSTVDILLPPEPQTREDFLQYCCPLSLDHNSVYNHLTLSEENRKVKYVDQDQRYPDHSDRFTMYCQVLCREGLSGRCYWELEWKGGYMFAAVAYKDIERTSDRSLFGYNDKSWSLFCSQEGYTFSHKNIQQEVSGPLSSRVGVYLDHEAGVLSFYSVSDTMTLLHKVSTTFTQPLYPGLYLGYGNEAELMKLWCRMCRM
ncbi:LOW QUALITY PROTEIN: tripartite motif-containing protein 16-like [Polymixia lowei]